MVTSETTKRQWIIATVLVGALVWGGQAFWDDSAYALPAGQEASRSVAMALAAAAPTQTPVLPEAPCPNGGANVLASVVAIEQPFFYNRLGASLPEGQMFALQHDVCPRNADGTVPDFCPGATLADLKEAAATGGAGVGLRQTKRPRPIVLRVNEGQCLRVRLTNLLSVPTSSGTTPATSTAAPAASSELVATAAATPTAATAASGGTTTTPTVSSTISPTITPTTPTTQGCSIPATSTAPTASSFGLVPTSGDVATVDEEDKPETRFYRQQRDRRARRNLLDKVRRGEPMPASALEGFSVAEPASKFAVSIHVQGMEWIRDSLDDGSWVGQNPNSLVPPGDTEMYSLFAQHEGDYLLYSAADTYSAVLGSDGGQLVHGLFGAVHVEPRGAEWYRSQATREELAMATVGQSADGQPILDYRAEFPPGNPRAGLPILNMLDCPNQASNGCPAGGTIVHSDLNAVITGRDKEGNPGHFPPIASGEPVFNPAYSLPNRLEPYREFTIIYHEVFGAQQAFDEIFAGPLNVDGNGADNFAFNYGMGGIAPEILANRLGVGPMADCTGCKYEEFFLSAWTVGDPAMVVDVPASTTCSGPTVCTVSGNICDPNDSNGCGTGETCVLKEYSCTGDVKATKVFYPDDPSNVYHSYMSDHTKFRVLHGGVDLHHVHHQHAHQWMHSPNTPNGDYTDSQSFGPGSSFTMEMVYNGSGNVNQTVGDSIFHCHFYPHFAMGMWSMWRVHDVFEEGTELDREGRPVQERGDDGQTYTVTRALPDGEIEAGTPIPAVVPMPTLAMAPMPARTVLKDNGTIMATCPEGAGGPSKCVSNLAESDPHGGATYKNPGFPFYIPGIAGQRALHPPLDFALATPGDPNSALDGGLPRHLIRECVPGVTDCTENPPATNFWNFSKYLENVDAFRVPEEGTFIEKVAMDAHATRFHLSFTPEGHTSRFVLNGLPPVSGAPFADPCIQFDHDGGVPLSLITREYKGADIQVDAVFNKEGWHLPQTRMIALWDDVKATITGEKAPEPLFFRANSGECIDYTLANLVPGVWELDDFEVRTPTDILGQHIHLVKFDVTSSDGAANGWNYEDGTFSPDEVTERIHAINAGGGLAVAVDSNDRKKLEAKVIPQFGPGPGGRWVGAQATVQRWYADPLFDGPTHDPASPGAKDRTLRTVFTHDHFGPSTHQQAGLYAGLVIEPSGSQWFDNENASAGPFGGTQNCTPIPGCTKGAQGNCLDCESIVVRADGGPTSWQAVIQTDREEESYREFNLLFQDTSVAYEPFDIRPPEPVGFCSGNQNRKCIPATETTPADTSNCQRPSTDICYAFGFCSNDPTKRCKPHTWESGTDVSTCGAGANLENTSCNLIPGIPGQIVAGYPLRNLLQGQPSVVAPVFAWGTQPIDAPGKVGPEIISFAGGTYSYSVNYRNEPLFPRIQSATGISTSPATSTTTATDPAFAYASIPRGSLGPGLPYPAATGVGANDPVTPLLRAYTNDDVQVRLLVGAHINPHNFTIHGNKWLMEPSFVDSGWRNSQVMGISEHFEMLFQVPGQVASSLSTISATSTATADYLYMPGAAAIEQQAGNWGIMRAYGGEQRDLRTLPQNKEPKPLPASAVCAPNAPKQTYDVLATTAVQVTGDPRGIIYNDCQQIIDPHGLVYVKTENLYDSSNPACSGANPNIASCPCSTPSASCKLKPHLELEPLVLRANAGDCIEVTLHNVIDTSHVGLGTNSPSLPPQPYSDPPTFGGGGCGSECLTSQVSTSVGLHPQLVNFDVTTSSAFNVGNNPAQTVPINSKRTYRWYAGNTDVIDGDVKYIPIELGATNLLPSDVLNHFQYGLFGGLIIEPEGSTWDRAAGTTAFVDNGEGSFREFVLFFQDGLHTNNNEITPSLVNNLLDAVNYKTEPLPGVRTCPMEDNGTNCVLSNSAACGALPCGDPETPIFQACAGEKVRMRVLHPGGIDTNNVFELYGHVWAETPYQSTGLQACDSPTTHTNPYSSSVIDTMHTCQGISNTDSLTDWQGSRMGIGPANHNDVLLESAGGVNAVVGDYLYRSFPAMHFKLGPWGLMRVQQCVSLPGSTAGRSSGAGQ